MSIVGAMCVRELDPRALREMFQAGKLTVEQVRAIQAARGRQ
jgi:hypothetical protein